nr:VanZ family protein [Allomuricauda sp.]
MPIFTSSREKRLWLYALAIALAIFATLFVGRPLANQLRDQNVQAIFFSIGLLLVGAVMLVYGWRTKPSRMEMALILGFVAVYTLFVFRLGAPERSHLIEYSVLAIFIHRALMERKSNGKKVPYPIVLAFIATCVLGILDESLQRVLPNRTFDMEDIYFNGMSAGMALMVKAILTWARKRFRSNS